VVLKDEEEAMTWDEAEREMSYQHIAALHADAERYRQVRASRRRRQRRSRGRLGRLLWPTRVASRANDVVGGIISPRARRDNLRPGRLDSSLGR
jgi:hypothetical protein